MATPRVSPTPETSGFPRLTRNQWIVFVVVVVAVSGGLLAALYTPQSSCNVCQGCIPPGSGNTPLGSGFALNTPIPEGGPTNHSYRMNVVPSSGIRWSDLEFHLTDSAGTNLSSTPSWAVWAFANQSGTGTPLAEYDITTHQWSAGADVLITSGEVLSLQLGSTNLAGQGDKLVLLGAGFCGGGQVSASLP